MGIDLSSAIMRTSNAEARMPKNPYGQIAIYPNEELRKKIEEEAQKRSRKLGQRTGKLGPTVLEIVIEYFKKKRP
jgi:hypothetical protein